MNKLRSKGFYWVRYYNEWMVAEYQGTELGYWYMCGNECGFNDADFEDIGDQIKITGDGRQ